MSKAKIYQWRGKEYTLRELAELAPSDVFIKTLASRIRDGWTIEDAMTRPLRGGQSSPESRTYEIDGRTYTFDELCALAPEGVNAEQVKYRLNDGWTPEQVIRTERGRKRRDGPKLHKAPERRQWLYQGEMLTACELAAIATNGMESWQIYDRLRNGWSVEEAITKPKGKRRLRPEATIKIKDDVSDELHVALAWIKRYVMTCWTTYDGAPIEGPKQTGTHEVTFEREFYRWVFSFHDLEACSFTVRSYFRKTDALSYPIYLYVCKNGTFKELARYDEDGRDLLKPRARAITGGGLWRTE